MKKKTCKNQQGVGNYLRDFGKLLTPFLLQLSLKTLFYPHLRRKFHTRILFSPRVPSVFSLYMCWIVFRLFFPYTINRWKSSYLENSTPLNHIWFTFKSTKKMGHCNERNMSQWVSYKRYVIKKISCNGSMHSKTTFIKTIKKTFQFITK